MAGVDGTESPMEEDSADEGTAKSKTCIECKALKQSTEVRPPAPAGRRHTAVTWRFRDRRIA